MRSSRTDKPVAIVSAHSLLIVVPVCGWVEVVLRKSVRALCESLRHAIMSELV